nr:hypothetical protein [Providencia stuartii]ELR5082916.1 hypothetical protein [Providencia stuartii]
MSNQHLETVISELSARVTQQSAQIEELQKQLTDMQAAMSCGNTSTSYVIKAKV